MDQTILSNEPLGEKYPETRVHTLLFVSGEAKGVRIHLGSDPITIGRSETNSVVLNDREVSNAHCEVTYHDGNVHVRDLGSTNGTFLDGVRVRESKLAPEVRLKIGQHELRYEFRDADEITRVSELAEDLESARDYVQALLPAPLASGPMHTSWTYVPCTELGGDGFGYHELPAGKIALYLLDVCGHGVRAALHAVAALNSIRNQSLPDVDFAQPTSVLERLSEKFGVESHDGLFFTIWYGVFDTNTRQLDYCTAGHPPGLLLTAHGMQRLHCHNPPIGVFEDCPFESASTKLPAGARIVVMSDGVYEIVDKSGERWGFEDIEPIVQQYGAAPDACTAIHEQVLASSRDPDLDDDFSLLIATFP